MRKKITMLLASLFACVGVMKADFVLEYGTNAMFWTERQLDATEYPEGVAAVLAEHAATEGQTEKTHEVWGATTAVKVTADGNVTVTFQYQNWSANHQLIILGVDIVGAEGVVESDYHFGKAGGNPTDNAYTLEGVAAGDYTVRYFVCNRTDDDHKLQNTAGKIVVAGADLNESPVVLDETKVYRLKAVNTNLYLEVVDFAKTSGEGALQFKTKSSNSGQLFTFEGVNGKYYIKTLNEKTKYYVTAQGWDFYAKTTAPSDGFEVSRVGLDLYAFKQTYANYKGYLGNENGAAADRYVYNNQGNYAKGASSWVLEEVDFGAYKTTAINALKTLGTAVDFTAAETAINAVQMVDGDYETYYAAIDAVVNEATQYVAFRNADADANSVRYNNYLGADMVKSKGNGTNTFKHLSAVWSLKYTGAGSFYIYNVNNKVYLGKPNENGALTETPKVAYTFELVEANKVELKYDGQTLHLNNHDQNDLVSEGTFLSSYDSDDAASRWYVETDFASHVATYKTSQVSALESLPNVCALIGVDATNLIADAKAGIEAIATTDYATFAAIDAEFETLANAIAAKDVVFQNSNTENPNRSEVYLATNMSNNKGRGIKVFDNSAVWSLRHAGGAAFYLYNGLNKVYLGNPSGAGTLTSAPAASYTFEVVNAETKLVELKSGNQTLHVNNNAECTLTNYDQDESASRWYVSTIDITAGIQALIDANADKHAETPELGQYSTAGYEALVAAKSTVKTVEEVEAAIAAFEASLNAPVYIISGVHDYAKDKAIYYNGANPEWRWDTKNIYNKAMWFRIPGLTTSEFALDTDYNIVDMDGRNIYNKEAVKFYTIENWEGVYNLKYGTADYDYIHAANHSNNTIANWYAATDNNNQASAWKVEYIGNTYDLNKLTEENFAAANDLAAVSVPGFNFAAGVNNYDETTKPALDAAIANRATVLGKFSTADEIAAAKTQLDEAIASVKLNMPENGKFYRVRCVSDGMKRIQSTINNDRLQMISGDEGINASSIFCYIDGALLSYTTGQYINAYNFDAVGTKSTVAFSKAYNGTLGQYNIKINDARYIYGKKDEIDSGTGNPSDAGYNWWLEEVTTLPVTITSAGYATFYAPVQVTLPAEGITAHTVTENGDYATLSEAITVVPAKNGVILAGAEGTYNLTITNTEAADLENALEGTFAKTLVTKTEGDAYYVLAKKDDKVGLYNPVNGADKTTFYNAGFKAYWHIADASQGAGYRIGEDEDATAIDQLLNDGELVIYDLSGRRVQKMEKGIYIVNGKKVIR